MIPYSEIKIGDIFSDPYYRFREGYMLYIVLDKNDEEKMIKIQTRGVFDNYVGRPFWVKSSNDIFCESWRDNAMGLRRE